MAYNLDLKQHVIDSNTKVVWAIAAFQPVFPGVPVVLKAQGDGAGRPATGA